MTDIFCLHKSFDLYSFVNKAQLLTQKLLKQCHVSPRLKISSQKKKQYVNYKFNIVNSINDYSSFKQYNTSET
jgi:hypothetical protein